MPKLKNARAVTDLDITIGSRIREARHEVNLTIEELATRVGITHQQMAKYETGMNRISASRLWHVAVALGQSVIWFFGEDQPIPGMSLQTRLALENAEKAIKKALRQ